MVTIKMSDKELKKMTVIERVINGIYFAEEAATLIGVSKRQVFRLRKQYVQEGASGLAHKNREGVLLMLFPKKLKLRF